MAYNNNRTYLAIDLKSYYASAECARQEPGSADHQPGSG